MTDRPPDRTGRSILLDAIDPVGDAAARGRHGLEAATAVGVGTVLGLRVPLHLDVLAGFPLMLALIPVTLSIWSCYRGARLLVVLSGLAVVSGLFLTWAAAAEGRSDAALAIVQTSRILTLGVGALALLWVRSVVGTRLTALSYGVGALVSVALVGVNPDNPWKFSLSVPLTLILLSLPGIHGRKELESVVLLGLGAISVLNDSRSAAAMMIVAAGLVLTRRRADDPGPRTLWPAVVRLATLCVGGFYFVQAAALEGALGEGAQARTTEQIERSGSLLAGGRPELGASLALLMARPLGYGAGTLASPSDVLSAKTGMAALNYDPDNGYVEGYMFGYGFEVHSFLGDLWILAGPVGALLALTVVGLVVLGTVRGLVRGTATGVVVFLALRTMWDLAFSPLPTVMVTVVLAVAITLPERAGRGPSTRASEVVSPREAAPRRSASPG